MKAAALMVMVFSLAACAPEKSVPEPSQAVSSSESATTSQLAPATVLLPEAFMGHWDASIAACKTASDLKLVITQTEMTFWESTGQISSVTVNAPDDVTVKAAFSGEGEQWQRDLHLVLSGDTLTVDGTARVRCPV